MGNARFEGAATSHDAAVKAARLAVIDYEELTPVLSVKDALAQQNFVRPTHTQSRGDAPTAIAASKHQLSGELQIGGQEQFYLERHRSSDEPTQEGGLSVYSHTHTPVKDQSLIEKA